MVVSNTLTEKTLDNQGNLVKTDTNTVGSSPTSRQGPFAETIDAVQNNLELLSESHTLQGGTTVTTAYQYDMYGNQTNSTTTDSAGALLQEFDAQYSPYTDPAVNLLRLPSVVSRSDATSSFSTSYLYDEAITDTAAGAPGHNYSLRSHAFVQRGNPTTVTRNGVSYASGYDELGNALRARDGRQNLTSYGFDDSWAGAACLPGSNTRAFLTSLTNAAGQISRTSYYPCTGAVATVQDPNDVAASRNGLSNSYDFMGMLTQSTRSTGQTVTIGRHAYSFPMVTTSTVTATPSPSRVTAVTLDLLGRPRLYRHIVQGGARRRRG